MTRSLWVAGAVAAVAVAAGQGRTDALDSLVRAERAFARMSVETSQREAFLANFANDGVWFSPGPANTKEALRKQSVPPGPPARTLDWEPVAGDVSVSGDLGYTTGPYLSSAKAADKPPTTGWFFSVWKRAGDGPWQVVADFGIGAPASGAIRPRAFQRALVQGAAPGRTSDAQASGPQLKAADAAFAEEASAHGLSAAYRARSTGDVLVYRQGNAPVTGIAPVLAFMPAGQAMLAWLPSYAESSGAGDLGFTYGSYAATLNGGAEQRGYYLHVWKRLPSGWKLAVDVTN
jgi:ketosteroid isomerase-like protein